MAADPAGRDLPIDPDAASMRRPSAAAGRHGSDLAVALAVACGGALGALARYFTGLALPTHDGRFPWGTLLINTAGSAVLGCLLPLLLEQFPRSRFARPLLGTGVVGAFTTFSTFCVETVQLLRAGDPSVAAAYVGASLAAGLAAAWLGMAGTRLAVRPDRWRRRAGP